MTGQTALVGTLSFVSAQFDRVIPDGVCDERSPTLMVAFETDVCPATSGPPCVSGASRCCGDVAVAAVCAGGSWTCPSGSVPVSSCTGFGMNESGTCANP
ncbi:MAG TPA: hypothetical protein VGP07_10375 [Polyangia bacterium]